MPLRAIFLGSLGALGETSELHRRALNAAFAEAGVRGSVSADAHRKLARQPCRNGTHLSDHARACGVAVDPARVHRRQTEIFREMLGGARMTPRPGLKRLIDATRAADLELALVTTAEPADVDAMLAVTGFDRSTFSFVGDADTVVAPKPAPDIYLAALKALEIAPQEALAIEETPENAAAARALNIQCVSFPGAFCRSARAAVRSRTCRARRWFARSPNTASRAEPSRARAAPGVGSCRSRSWATR